MIPASSQYRDAVMMAISSEYDISENLEARIADHIEDDRQNRLSVEESTSRRKAWLQNRAKRQAQLN